MSLLAGVALGAKLLRVRKALGRVPWQAWAVLGLLLALWGGWSWHQRKVAAADRAGFERGKTATQAAYRKHLAGARVIAQQRRAAAEAEAAAITKDLNNETQRLRARLAADAGRVLDHGPGAAACPGRLDHPGVSRGAGEQRSGARRGPAMDPLPAGEGQPLIGLPFAPTIALAANHDALRLEVLAWREWHRRQSKAWEIVWEERRPAD